MSAARGNIFLAGVGGQGILLASEILGEAFLRGGYDVKKSEVHGMAQRGGAVTTHLRFGPKVFSPLIEPGTADLLIAFEKMEALRFIHYLAPDGVAVVNVQEIPPAPVSSGQERYPERIEERLREVTPRVHLVDALGGGAGAPRGPGGEHGDDRGRLALPAAAGGGVPGGAEEPPAGASGGGERPGVPRRPRPGASARRARVRPSRRGRGWGILRREGNR